MHTALHQAFHSLHHFAFRHPVGIVTVLLASILVAIACRRPGKLARGLMLVGLAISTGAGPALAQSETALRAYFEGRTVTVKLEMPGAAAGVDVYPGATQAIDYPRHARRLKDYGTAYRKGDEALITKVKVKNDLIEFQLGGGGFGTFQDDAIPYVAVSLTPKTEREKNLERDITRTTDPAKLRRKREELDALRRDRQREDVRIQADAAQLEQMRQANIRQRRAESGSRFNIRYQPGVPMDAVTPEAVMRALEQFVEFR